MKKAIRKADDAYVEAYNKHNAKTIASMWSPEAVYIDPQTGKESVGREEIEKEFADTFANLKDAKLEVNERLAAAKRR
jgi:ketosteroid isomerase-like protein